MSAEPSHETAGRAAGAVTITATPLWRLRLMRSLPRYLLYALCAAGTAASVRFAVAPPSSAPRSPGALAPPPLDPAAEGYATLFARRYLTWDAARPQTSEALLDAMGGSGLAQDAGLALPPSGAQHVEWAEVVQARRQGPGAHVYTVAAQTDAAGLVYLTVDVVRRANGSLALAGYPAFVGAPAQEAARPPSMGDAVGDPSLATVLRRALRNYLAATPEEVDADLSEGAQVVVPGFGLTLETVQKLVWSTVGRSVLAVVQARDVRDARYTLGYEVDVVEVGGRWEVSAIQVDPDQ
ncbi:MAG TPA: hypothetical protein VHW67_02530 [Solirubrobacteraceae bacterium]|nr:hypothetical protein [Solirubrobacteraceae bacterium]